MTFGQAYIASAEQPKGGFRQNKYTVTPQGKHQGPAHVSH
jgi:hypothetical protein